MFRLPSRIARGKPQCHRGAFLQRYSLAKVQNSPRSEIASQTITNDCKIAKLHASDISTISQPSSKVYPPCQTSSNAQSQHSRNGSLQGDVAHNSLLQESLSFSPAERITSVDGGDKPGLLFLARQLLQRSEQLSQQDLELKKSQLSMIPTESQPSVPLPNLPSHQNIRRILAAPILNAYRHERLSEAEQMSKTNNNGIPDGRESFNLRPRGLDIRFTTPPVDADAVALEELQSPQLAEIPKLAHKLERVLFNPGVHFMKCPRSGVYNFDPVLQNLLPLEGLNGVLASTYTLPSKDLNLLDTAQLYNKKYAASSSSLTGILSHLHFLLSRWRPLTTSMLSNNFIHETASVPMFQRLPVSVFLRLNKGIYSIDPDKEFDTETILTRLGHTMEAFLTHSTDELRSLIARSKPQSQSSGPGTYRLSSCGSILMRSQLDAADSRLPNSGIFDLKTRATVSVRMDVENHEEAAGYQIKALLGPLESFEREYYDLIRNAMLKYSIQARIGNMDGMFIAYHNTHDVFGFQYIGIEDLDLCVHGSLRPQTGDMELKLSLRLLETLLNEATARFPGKSLRLWFETRDTLTPFMYFFAEPIDENECEQLQHRNEENEREIVAGIRRGFASTEDLLRVLESAHKSILEPPDGNQEFPDVSTLESAFSSEQEPSPKKTVSLEGSPGDLSDIVKLSRDEERLRKPLVEIIEPEKAPDMPGNVLAFTVSIQNHVNGIAVVRPIDLGSNDKWATEFTVAEARTPERASKAFSSCRNRRIKHYERYSLPKMSSFIRTLRRLSQKGLEEKIASVGDNVSVSRL